MWQNFETLVIYESVLLECWRKKNGGNQSKRTKRHVLWEPFQVYFSKCTCLQNERYSPNGLMASGSYRVLLKDLKKKKKRALYDPDAKILQYLYCSKTHDSKSLTRQKIAHKLFFKMLLKYCWFTMFCYFLLHSKVTQLSIYIYIYTRIYILFHIIFLDELSRDTKYSSLCYTVRPCCLSVYMTNICIY